MALENNHSVFSLNPQDVMKYVDKQVVVTCKKGVEMRGVVYSIDPITENLILACLGSRSEQNLTGSPTIHLLAKDYIQDISETGPALEEDIRLINNIFNPPEKHLAPEMVEKRKAEVKALLEAHRLPVEETSNADLRLGQLFTISAPYFARNCTCANEIILAKVQKLLNEMTVV